MASVLYAEIYLICIVIVGLCLFWTCRSSTHSTSERWLRVTLTGFDPAAQSGTLEIVCGKGTYVRTIIHDIGGVLGCGGCMTSLVRTAACGFTLADAHSFDEVQQAADSRSPETLMIPTDRLFSVLPAVTLSAAQTRLYKNGVRLDLNRVRGISADALRYRVYGDDGHFFGLADADPAEGCLRVLKNL